MGEDIEPVDPVDTVAVTEGLIAPDEVRPLDEPLDELDTDPVLDNDRIVLLDDHHATDANPEKDPRNTDPYNAPGVHYDDLAPFFDPFDQ